MKPNEQTVEEQDPFLSFVDYARSVIVSDDASIEGDAENSEAYSPGWGWVVSRLLKSCICYSSGVTPAILLSDLYHAWGEHQRIRAPKRRQEIINHLKTKNKRIKLPKTVTIDSLYEKNFLSLSSVLEAVVIESFLLPGTNIHMLRLGDYWSSNTIDLYLHRRYHHLVDTNSGLLAIGREIFLTGCYIRSTKEGKRLLPTEYLLILLDDEDDDDAMLIAAQFCYDAFSSLSHSGNSSNVSYSLYARIESIGPINQEAQAHNNVQWREITLVDNEGIKMKFLLWGEQVILANLLSLGSMLAIDNPYIANGGEEICLEYGSATQLYLIPFIKPEEQVSVQMSHTPTPKVSQVKLLCDFHGSIDFSNYPIRSLVADLCEKMTCFSLYGTVAEITRSNTSTGSGYTLRIEDPSGSTDLTLYFTKKWSLGRVSEGHTIFISGLSTRKSRGRLEVFWFEKDEQSCFVNISCLPAIQNSTCLHRMTRLSDLSTTASFPQVCHVRLDNVEHCQIDVRFVHSVCGNVVSEDCECRFCGGHCGSDVKRSFHLVITIADDTRKILGWCVGETASQMLQISPDEFSDFPEDEQLMYPCSLESEEFVVCFALCKKKEDHCFTQMLTSVPDQFTWEITRAKKCDDSQLS